MASNVPTRSEIAPEYKWNAEYLFESADAWRAELHSVRESLPGVRKFQGHLADGRTGRLLTYASISHSVDTADQAATAMYGEAVALVGQAQATVSFIDPELLAIGEGTLKRWLQDEPRLGVYAHYVENLFRKQAHVRSVEVEELLGMLSDPFNGAYNTMTM